MSRHLATPKMLVLAGTVLFSLAISPPAFAQQKFSSLVGPVQVGPVKAQSPLEVPYITWGGDVATFLANGGTTTAPGSIYQQLGLNLKLVPGDDFVEQVRRYMRGESPFLRGTMRMIGMASEVIGSQASTKPVVFLQLTWSRGDHCVAREGVKTLNDLKGKKIVLQQGGPHVGMLDDMLASAKLDWKDINVVWVDDLTGDNGPAARFRADNSIDCCMVISPDMIGLTGGLDGVGTGAEGTARGARVLISTATMTRSIADVYACRKDFYDAHRAEVDKFLAGYLKGCEDLLAQKKVYEERGAAAAAPYMKTLGMAQQIYGKDVLPLLEVDAHGLVSDCAFVGLPGNASFFLDRGNLNGFEPKQEAALNLAVNQGYAGIRTGFFPPGMDYAAIKQLGKLTQDLTASSGEVDFGFEGLDKIEDKDTLLSFTISFDPNQIDFPESVYGAEFDRALKTASTFGNAIMVIRGHADPTQTLIDTVKAGLAKGVITRTGSGDERKYYINGRPLDLAATKEVAKLVEEGRFDGGQPNPRETMQLALNLSNSRAQRVRESVLAYAKKNGVTLNETQIQSIGVGVLEPIIAKPRNLDEAKQNMRVEFRLVKRSSEVASPADFDF